MLHYIRVGRRRLQLYLQGFSRNKDTDQGIAAELQRERERRWQVESELRQVRTETVARDGSGRAHPLPEPDETINRRQIFLSLISPLRAGRILDLGTGPGTFSLAAAGLGWQATAVDARTMRMPKAEAGDRSNRAELIRKVEWVESDVRSFPIGRDEYDLICIFGLMHHLRIKDQVNLLKRCSHTLTYLSVRVSPDILDEEGPYEGRYHQEAGDTQKERDQIAFASWGNEYSFLHTEQSLTRLLRDCGYSKVLAMRPPHKLNYTFYVALPYI